MAKFKDGMRHHDGVAHYESNEPRGRYYDRAMISEDDSKQASMPTEIKMENYPESTGYMPAQEAALSGGAAIAHQIEGDTVRSVKPRKA